MKKRLLILLVCFSFLFVGVVSAKTTVNFWNGLTGPDGQVMNVIVKDFNETHPNIEVKQQQIVWDTYWNKLLATLVSGTAPEVFIVHTNELPIFSSKGLLQPLDNYVEQIPEDDRLDFWSDMVIDGHRYGIPQDFHPVAMYYNKNLFEKEGLEKPVINSYEDFVELLEKFTVFDSNGEVIQYAHGFSNGAPWFKRDLISYAAQYGDTMLNDAGTEATFNSEGFKKSLEFLKMLVDKQYAPGLGEDAWMLFKAGKVAMCNDGPWMMLGLDSVEFDWGVVPFPQIGPEKAQWMSNHVLTMPAGLSKDVQEAAWTFMKYISDHGIQWAAAGQIPARKSQLEDSQFKQMSAQYAFSLGKNTGVYEPIHFNTLEIEEAYASVVSQVLSGELTIEEALQKAENNINRVLN